MDESPTQGVSKHEADNLVAQVVRYLLFRSYHEPGVPVKREELTRIVSKDYKQRSLPGKIIDLAHKRLRSVFGFELRELQKPRPGRTGRGASQGASDSGREYVLRSSVPGNLQREYVDVKETSVRRGLTLAIIGIVSLCGDKCPEEALWSYLGKLGLSDSDDAHGNIKVAVEAVLKQRFILKERAGDGEGFVYTLAERALDEPVKLQVQQFISKLMQGGADVVPSTPSE